VEPVVIQIKKQWLIHILLTIILAFSGWIALSNLKIPVIEELVRGLGEKFLRIEQKIDERDNQYDKRLDEIEKTQREYRIRIGILENNLKTGKIK
jgi:hypothetical protein